MREQFIHLFTKLISFLMILVMMVSLINSVDSSRVVNASCGITIPSNTSTYNINVGDSLQLPMKNNPNFFRTSDSGIATVTNSGIVNGISVGSANISSYSSYTVFGFINITLMRDSYTVVVNNSTLCTVSFNSNGGTEIPSQTVNAYQSISKPDTPVRNGFEFAGWYINDAFTSEYYFNEAVTEDITLYAKWNKVYYEESSPLDEDDSEVEIRSFNIDQRELAVNQTNEVTFTAEVFYNVILEDNSVSLYKDGEFITYLNDDGINGDVEAEDSIFTVKIPVISNDIGDNDYYVVVNNQESEKISVRTYTPLSKADLDSINKVNNRISVLMKRKLYGSLSLSNKANSVKSLLNTLSSEGLIKSDSVSYNPTHAMYTFQYECGVNSLVLLTKPEDDVVVTNDLTGGLGDLSGSDDTVSDNFKVTILNAFDNESYRQDYYNNLASKWNSMNLSTKVDTDVTVSDIRNLMNMGDVVVLSMHGIHINPNYGLILNETVNEDTTGKYAFCDGFYIGEYYDGTQFYVVDDTFIDSSYNSTALDNVAIYSESCMFYGCDCISTAVDRTFANSFLNASSKVVVGYHNSVLADYSRDVMALTIEESFNGKTFFDSLNIAKSQLGDTDGYANGLPASDPDHKFIAYPVISGNNNYILRPEGGVEGTVSDARTRTNLKNATVRVLDYHGTEIVSSKTDRKGHFRLSLPNGEYILKVDAAKRKTASISFSVENGQYTHLDALMIIGLEVVQGQSSGIITNALTGAKIPNVSVKVRKGYNNYNGKILTTVLTDASGHYQLSFANGLSNGYYTVELAKKGFVTIYKNICISSDISSTENHVMAPVGGSDEYRIVLSWGASPRDMDSHLIGKTSDGSEFHVYYSNRDVSEGDRKLCSLDLDDTSSYGPETITFTPSGDEPFYYYVFQYSTDGTMSTSKANVSVYKGNSLIREYSVPTDQGDGRYWNVFAITDGNIVEENTITDEANITYASSLESSIMLMSVFDIDAEDEEAQDIRYTIPKETSAIEDDPISPENPVTEDVVENIDDSDVPVIEDVVETIDDSDVPKNDE